MCNLYGTVDRQTLRSQFSADAGDAQWETQVAPLRLGVFVRAQAQAQAREQTRVQKPVQQPVQQPVQALVGQWGLIPPGASQRLPTGRDGRRMSTHNARRERLASAPTFRTAWARGQRCLIPALWFQEPYWGITTEAPMAATHNTWWRFWPADGQPWALAGLWSEWTDPATGAIVPSFTMITQNCDGHPVLSLMHKPDTALPPDAQDKRTVVPLARQDWDAWLHASPQVAEGLMRVPPVEALGHGPAHPDAPEPPAQAALF